MRCGKLRDSRDKSLLLLFLQKRRPFALLTHDATAPTSPATATSTGKLLDAAGNADALCATMSIVSPATLAKSLVRWIASLLMAPPL